MKVLIVYESMFGHTHQLADRIAAGLGAAPSRGADPPEVAVRAAHDVDRADVDAADAIVVGGPTHAHGLPRPMTRSSAIDVARKEDLELDPDAEGDGLREWFDRLRTVESRPAAAFDTRYGGPPLLTGRASRGIARRLRRHGFELAADAESFVVDKNNELHPGEAERAERWGASLAAAFEDRTLAPG